MSPPTRSVSFDRHATADAWIAAWQARAAAEGLERGAAGIDSTVDSRSSQGETASSGTPRWRGPRRRIDAETRSLLAAAEDHILVSAE